MTPGPQPTAERFRASLDLPFPLVGDPRGQITRAYGVRWPLVGLARRVSFLIGRDRKVLSALHSERDVEAHARWALEQATGAAAR